MSSIYIPPGMTPVASSGAEKPFIPPGMTPVQSSNPTAFASSGSEKPLSSAPSSSAVPRFAPGPGLAGALKSAFGENAGSPMPATEAGRNARLQQEIAALGGPANRQPGGPKVLAAPQGPDTSGFIGGAIAGLKGMVTQPLQEINEGERRQAAARHLQYEILQGDYDSDLPPMPEVDAKGRVVGQSYDMVARRQYWSDRLQELHDAAQQEKNEGSGQLLQYGEMAASALSGPAGEAARGLQAFQTAEPYLEAAHLGGLRAVLNEAVREYKENPAGAVAQAAGMLLPFIPHGMRAIGERFGGRASDTESIDAEAMAPGEAEEVPAQNPAVPVAEPKPSPRAAEAPSPSASPVHDFAAKHPTTTAQELAERFDIKPTEAKQVIADVQAEAAESKASPSKFTPGQTVYHAQHGAMEVIKPWGDGEVAVKTPGKEEYRTVPESELSAEKPVVAEPISTRAEQARAALIANGESPEDAEAAVRATMALAQHLAESDPQRYPTTDAAFNAVVGGVTHEATKPEVHIGAAADPNIQQQDANAPKGSFDPATGIIHLAKTGDVSTWLHEFMHGYVRVAPKADVALLEEWRGRPLAEWTRTDHEAVSTAYERYHYEGRSPTPKLAPVFARIKAAMARIYQSVRGTRLETQMDPRAREFFDRAYGKDAEPVQAKAPPPKSEKYAGSVNIRLLYGDPAAADEVRATAKRLGLDNKTRYSQQEIHDFGKSLGLSYADIEQMEPGSHPAAPKGIDSTLWQAAYADAVRNLHAQSKVDLLDARRAAREASDEHAEAPSEKTEKAVADAAVREAEAQRISDLMQVHDDKMSQNAGTTLQMRNRESTPMVGQGYGAKLAEAPTLAEAGVGKPAPTGAGRSRTGGARRVPFRVRTVSEEEAKAAVARIRSRGTVVLTQLAEAPQNEMLYQHAEPDDATKDLVTVGKFIYESGVRDPAEWKAAVEKMIGEKLTPQNAEYVRRLVKSEIQANIAARQMAALKPLFVDRLGGELGSAGSAQFLIDLGPDLRDKLLTPGIKKEDFSPAEQAAIKKAWDENQPARKRPVTKASATIAKQIAADMRKSKRATTDPLSRSLKSGLRKNLAKFTEEIEKSNPGLLARVRRGEEVSSAEMKALGDTYLKHFSNRSPATRTKGQEILRKAVAELRKAKRPPAMRKSKRATTDPLDLAIARRVKGGLASVKAIKADLNNDPLGTSALAKLQEGKDLSDDEGRRLARAIDTFKRTPARNKPSDLTQRLTKLIDDARHGRLGYDNPKEAARAQLYAEATAGLTGLRKDTPRYEKMKAAADKKVAAIAKDLDAVGDHDTQAIARVMMKHTSLADKFNQYVLTNILSSPDTAAKIVEAHPTTVMAEDLRRWFFGDRGEVGPGIRAGFSAMKTHGWSDAAKILREGPTVAALEGKNYYRGHGGRIPTELNAPGFNLLMRAHSAFYQLLQVYNAERGLHLVATEEGRAKGLTGADLEDYVNDVRLHPEAHRTLVDKAIKFAQEETQTNPNAFTQFVNRAANRGGVIGRLAKTLFLPVLNIGLNAAGRTLESTTGLLSNVALARMYERLHPDATPAEIEEYQQKVMQRGAIGAGLAGIAALAAYAGVLLPPDPKHGRYTSELRIGKRQYEVPAGNIGGVADTGAILGNAARHPDLTTAGAADLARQLAAVQVNSNPIFRTIGSVSDAASAISGNIPTWEQSKALSQFGANIASEIIPMSGALRWSAAFADRNKGERKATSFAQDVERGLPGLRGRLPMSFDKLTGHPYPQPIFHSIPAESESEIQAEDRENYNALHGRSGSAGKQKMHHRVGWRK